MVRRRQVYNSYEVLLWSLIVMVVCGIGVWFISLFTKGQRRYDTKKDMDAFDRFRDDCGRVYKPSREVILARNRKLAKETNFRAKRHNRAKDRTVAFGAR